MNSLSLRSWWDIDHDRGLGNDLDPVEEFIHSNEPQSRVGGTEEEEFRTALKKMLDYVREQSIRDYLQHVSP